MSDIPPIRKPAPQSYHIATRLGPVHLDSEMIVLGRCVQSAEAITKAKAALTPEDFFQANHAEIFSAICAIGLDPNIPPLMAVSEMLRKRGTLEEIGSHAWFTEVIDKTETNAVLPHHIRKVKDAATKRRVMTLTLKAYELASDDQDCGPIIDQLCALRSTTTTPRKRGALR